MVEGVGERGGLVGEERAGVWVLVLIGLGGSWGGSLLGLIRSGFSLRPLRLWERGEGERGKGRGKMRNFDSVASLCYSFSSFSLCMQLSVVVLIYYVFGPHHDSSPSDGFPVMSRDLIFCIEPEIPPRYNRIRSKAIVLPMYVKKKETRKEKPEAEKKREKMLCYLYVWWMLSNYVMLRGGVSRRVNATYECYL